MTRVEDYYDAYLVEEYMNNEVEEKKKEKKKEKIKEKIKEGYQPRGRMD